MENNKCLRFASVMKTAFRLIRLGMPKWLLCLLGVTLAGLGSYLLALLVGLVMSVTVRDYALGISAVPRLTLLLLMLASFVPLVVLGYQFNLRGGLGIRASIQKKLLSAWLRQTERFAAERHSGEAMALLNSDMQILENFYFQGMMMTFFMPFVQGIASLITIAVVDWRLTFIPLVFGFLALMSAILLGGRIHSRNVHLRKQTDAAVSDFSDLLAGNTAHRYWGTVDAQLDAYERTSDNLARDGVAARNLDVHVRSISALLSAVSMVVFFSLGILLIRAGEISFASLLLAYPLQSSVFEMVNCLGNTWRLLITSAVSGDRVIDALAAPQEDNTPADCLKESGETLEFSEVVFGYQAKNELLNGLSFTVRSGENVALVGASGCGKTTVFKLLLKFYEPDSGSITLHGIDSAACSPNEWRSKLIYLEQSAPLLHRTVRENIAMGRYGDDAEPTEDEIIRAAKAAGAHQFIQALPQGYDTLVDECGENFSGGQRQRIAIARAFLSSAKFLLLDEPTAALDTQSQQVVWKSLQKLMKQKTVLIISHNLESLKICDRILVMEDGQIKESGTHDELLAKEGLYAALYKNQFR
ncbi:MAG TPA: ABC transporter ATP-binding protein [Candidatus Limiplasma sp.]|nr:ABC transporter ATP-binding protein [Candidatus Limiplasma sp.]HRX07600.1 ABC transporter ATP-binding protein [Candidatus Limiplasma sp.]